MTEPVVRADNVSKRFRLYHERNQSLKAAIMRRARVRYEEFWALRDVSLEVPEGSTFAESCRNLDEMVELAGEHQERTGVKLLWGTANLFSNPRFQAGAATNPDPELENAERAYYQSNLEHLIQVKRRYDPDDFFALD